jgi:uncharacterized protein YgbK (DUF1537 family)
VKRPLLGVIADDLTGACDLAGSVAHLPSGAPGMRTVVTLGTPSDRLLPDADCVIVALKSRTAPPRRAVSQSTEAARWLLACGAETLYQKYCSTFDSTDEGNIGPVADALLELVRTPGGVPTLSFGTPATPSVGRTQYLGHLFVQDRLLSESPLRDHPLTPMRDPDVVRVLRRQASGPVALIPQKDVRSGPTAVIRALQRHASAGIAHTLADALDDGDLDTLAEAALTATRQSGVRLVLGGGAGLASAIARRFRFTCANGGDAQRNEPEAVPAGRRLILSGSCSARSLEQVAAFDGPVVTVDPPALAAGGSAAMDELCARVRGELGASKPDMPVLVSATAAPGRVRVIQDQLGQEAAAEVVERALAQVALRAVREFGVTHVIVAGGETSGAVATALGAATLDVRDLAAVGVPWTVSRSGSASIALLLKSGNFGDAGFFRTAWSSAP